jgi:hypothetical protein
LERRDLRFRGPKREGRSQKRPWPNWVEEKPNRIWIYDTERHEAFFNRAVVKGHRHVPVAAGALKLRAA